MKFIAVVLFVLCVGCTEQGIKVQDTKAPAQPISQQTESESVSVPDAPKEPKIFVDLRAKAHKLRVHFKIFCGAGDGFMGVAWQEGDEFGHHYIEDGMKPQWWTDNDVPSQEDVARQLYKMLDRPPNWKPEHKPADEVHHHKICPPEITD